MSTALDWLRPANPEPVLLAPREDRVVRGAVHDGLLAPAGPGDLAAVDLLQDPAWRARSLAGVLVAGATLARSTAVWVHTGLHRPRVVEVLVPQGLRVHAPHLRVHTHHTVATDVVVLGGVPVTSLVRTAADLARWSSPEQAREQIAALVGVGLDPHEVLAHLAGRAGGPGTARARALLAGLAQRPGRAGRTPPRPSVADGPAEPPGSPAPPARVGNPRQRAGAASAFAPVSR
jgi:hypothetical protein